MHLSTQFLRFLLFSQVLLLLDLAVDVVDDLLGDVHVQGEIDGGKRTLPLQEVLQDQFRGLLLQEVVAKVQLFQLLLPSNSLYEVLPSKVLHQECFKLMSQRLLTSMRFALKFKLLRVSLTFCRKKML